MSLTVLVLALTPSQGVPYSPPAVLYPPAPFIGPGVEANFVQRTPYGYVPNLYPIVPQPVVIGHPEWYPHPGPAYWYANNVTPYHAVYHGVVHTVVPPKSMPVPVVPPKVIETPTPPPPPVKTKEPGEAKDRQ
jgi:hypothetical protein